jgi:membrane-bound lytic murein transglycosylase A
MSDAAGFALQAVSFDALEGWGDDDPSGLFEVMANCRTSLKSNLTVPVRWG